VRPIPEVRQVATQLAALSEQTLDLVPALEGMAELAVAVLPSCVGVSLTVVVDGEPFTVTATSLEIRDVDSAQYLAGDGPCLASSDSGKAVQVADVLDEQRWQEFAQVGAARGVRSSLSVPLRSPDGRTFGALNLYAGELGAFDGSEGEIAELFGGHAEEVVRDADLSFLTRDLARELPQRLADAHKVNQAIGVLTANRGMSAPEARERMEFAASRAGISLSDAADMVLILGTA
jgi:GAF domain-containing protein